MPVETMFEGETHDLGTLRLGRPVGDQRQLDAQLLQPVEGLVRIGERRQFLVVQRVIGVGQCVTDRLGQHRMAGHATAAKAVATMRRRAAPVRWRQYLSRAGSAHNSVEAASIAPAMTVASIGPSWSAKAAMVRCHCDCAGPNATRIVSSRSNRIARGNFMYAILAVSAEQ
jgi:hypothetical protein